MRYLTVRELCDRWRLTHTTVHRMIREGRLPAVRLGERSTRIPLDSVLAVEQSAPAP